MRGFVIAILMSLICSAFGQDVISDAEEDGQALAQQMVSKVKAIKYRDWSDYVKKAYAKHEYPAADEYKYQKAFKEAYQTAYTDLGSKVAGPRPEQMTSGDNEDVDEAIKKQLKLTPEDDFEFSHASEFDLATLKGKPVWRSDGYVFKAKGKTYGAVVVVDHGKIFFTRFF